MPQGVKVAKANYDDKPALVSALTGQDCLIITMSVFANPDSSRKLIEAAAEAGVAWILPNEWGIDHQDPVVAKETLIGEGIQHNRKIIEDLGKSSWIGVTCCFWYEYSLAAGPWSYGFDFDNKKVTFFDKGETKINTTTWPKVGAAVASLLSLPIHKEQGTEGPCLDDFKNNFCYVSSFHLTQREMFDSLLRVTGDKESDWQIEYVDVKEWYANGLKQFQAGSREGFGKCLYGRMFYPEAPGDFDKQGKSHNKVLGLEEEDLDQKTKGAVERWEKQGHMKM